MTRDRAAMGRRGFLQVAGSTAFTAALAGCGSEQAASEGGDGGGSNSFSFANWSGSTDALYDKIIADYAAANSVTVDQQANVPFADYQTRFRTLLSGGSPPDVMRLNDDFLRELSDKQQILDLSDYIASSGINTADYFPDVFGFTDLPNGQSGMAIGVQPRVIYYNKTLLEASGAPLPPTTWTSEGWTWDDFLAAATAATAGPDRWGAIVNLDTGFENTWAVNNGGSGLFSEDGREFTLADPEGHEAIQWVADLATRHRVSPPWAEIQAENADLDLFVAGNLAMLFGTMGQVGYLQENVADFEWDVAPVPGNAAQEQEGSILLFVIPQKAQNPDAAWDFVEYLSGPEGGQVFADNAAFIPVNRAAAESISSDGRPPASIALFAEAADHQASVNSTTATSQAVAIYRPQLERVYLGEISAEEALTGVRSQVEAVLAAGG